MTLNVHGWLLPQLLDLDRTRWSRYPAWQHTIETGEILPPVPIPFINLGTPAFDRGIKGVLKLLHQFSGEDYSDRDSMTDFSAWLLWSLGHPAFQETPTVLPVDDADIDLEPWISNPADYLGHLLSQYGRQNRTTNFFPTFQPCAHRMAEAAVQTMLYRVKSSPPFHGYEPCLGTGRLGLELSNSCRSLQGWELNSNLMKIALLNFTIFAPDFAFPFCRAGDLVVGDSLTGVGQSVVNPNRRYVGMEIDPEYCALARARIAKAQPTRSLEVPPA